MIAARRCPRCRDLLAAATVGVLAACGGDVFGHPPPAQAPELAFDGVIDVTSSFNSSTPIGVRFGSTDDADVTTMRQSFVLIPLDGGPGGEAQIDGELMPGEFWVSIGGLGQGWYFLGYRNLPTGISGTEIPGLGYGIRFSVGHHATLSEAELCNLATENPTVRILLSETRPVAEAPHFELSLGNEPCAFMPANDGVENYRCQAAAANTQLVVEPSKASCTVCPELVPASSVERLVLAQDDARSAGGCLDWAGAQIARAALAQ